MTLTESIEANVPARFADREWGNYIVRQFYENQSRAAADIGDEFADGLVKFAPQSGASTKITVELDIEPAPGADPEVEYSRARERVGSILDSYRTFVLRRCEKTHCRDN